MEYNNNKMKIFYSFIILVLLLTSGILLSKNDVKAATHNVSLSTNVQATLTLDITSGDTVPFGDLTAGSPIAAPAAGTVASVETNANNGYTLAISDAIAAPNSCLVNADLVTYIPDITSGDIATPALWGANLGLGMTLFAADGGHKEAKWGTGVTYNDANNKYAYIPETATVAHTVTGLHVGADTSSWAYKIDVAPSQKTGSYTGSMTFTATAVLL